MPPEQGVPLDQKTIRWEDYVRDARDLHLAMASAIPAATSVWTMAWSKWLASAAKTQEQMVGGWISLVRNPGRGAAVLDQMREEFKQYLLDVAAIPEHAVLEFIQKVTESARGPAAAAAPAESPLERAVDEVMMAAVEVARHSELAGEYFSAGRGQAERAPDALATLRQKIAALAELRRKPGPGAGRAGA